MSWIRVNKQSPCPICQHSDWCMSGDDGDSALCMRVPSQRPHMMTSGETGYIHLVKEKPEWKPKVYKPKPREAPRIDANRLFMRALSETTPVDYERLAVELGVTVDSLKTGSGVGCAWFKDYNAWGFPMMDGQYNMVGIRLRCSSTGRKWAVTGSKSGIFYPLSDPPLRVVICEGPTDTAAAIACGMFAIGRASCSSGLHEILQFLRTNRVVQEVAIVADNDAPGLKGARDLQERLRVRSVLVTLPCKDLRAFYKLGGGPDLLSSIVNNTGWFTPR